MSFNKQELTERLLVLRDNAKIVMAVAAALILLDGAVVLRWQFVSLGSMFSEARRLKTGIKEARSESKFSSTNKNRIADLEKQLADLNKKISDEEGLPRVLESISKFADVSSVRVQTIRPMGEVPAFQKTAAKSPDKSQNVYVRQKISLTLIAGFHQLGRFIALLENFPIFLDIRQVEIRGGQQEYAKQVVTIVLEVVLKKA